MLALWCVITVHDPAAENRQSLLCYSMVVVERPVAHGDILTPRAGMFHVTHIIEDGSTTPPPKKCVRD